MSFESPFAREDAVLHIPFANCITYIPALILLGLAIWAYKKSKSNPARVQDDTASCTTTTLESPLESEEIVDSAVTTAAKQLVSAIEAAMRKELEKQKASTAASNRLAFGSHKAPWNLQCQRAWSSRTQLA